MLNCIAIVEDPNARELLINACNEQPNISLQLYRNLTSASNALKHDTPDLLLVMLKREEFKSDEVMTTLRALAESRSSDEAANSGDTIDHLTLKVEYKSVKIPFKDIVYIQAMDNYMKIYRLGQPMIVSQITMKELERRLPSDRFVRVHRSYIVSVDKIIGMQRQYLNMTGGTAVPVSKTYMENLAGKI